MSWFTENSPYPILFLVLWFKPDWKLFSLSGLFLDLISKLLEAVFLTTSIYF